MLFASYPTAGESRTEIQTQLGLYQLALEGVPPEFVERACKAFIQGRVAGQNPSFRPRAAELANHARQMFDRAHAARAQDERIQRQLSAPDETPPTPEERDRVMRALNAAKAAISEKVNADMIGKPVRTA
jgi:hypothetical protein